MCRRYQPAGDHQSDEQSPADHTDSSARDAHPYKSLLFRQHHLSDDTSFSPEKSEQSLGNSHEPERAGLGLIYTPASKLISKNLVTAKYLPNP